MKRITLTSLLTAILLLVWGCGPANSGQADIRGNITTLEPLNGSRDIIGIILIESTINTDKARTTITDKTRILVQEGDKQRPADFAALQVGQTVEATFTGPIAESYPVQATAGQVVILR